jgi:outer membrane lipoprotein LolB
VRFPFSRAAAVIALSLLAGACSMAPVTDGALAERENLFEMRRAWLVLRENWSLDGRLAVNDGEDGGSGRLHWRTVGETSVLDFHGALGRGAWRLESEPGRSRLVLADGDSYRARSVGELVRSQLGWEIPVESLSWWVRGLAAPGAVENRQLDESGRLKELNQAGWRIEYGRYLQAGEVAMPSRMTATRDQRKVKLAVRQWDFTGADPANG